MTIAIETKDLCKKYQSRTVVKNLNLKVYEGELFALLGVNGAGKTTTIKMLSCLIKPTSGDALMFGKSINNDATFVKNITNVSPQETAVAPNLTVYENLDLMYSIYYPKNKDNKKKVMDMIKELKLDEVQLKKAKTLSGGWQRRLSIAMALITKPKILFLDEPTLGLDVIARRELWHVIEKIKGKTTIILTTHYLEEVEALSNRVGIMEHGNLVVVGTVQELIEKTNSKNFEDAFVKLATEEN